MDQCDAVDVCNVGNIVCVSLFNMEDHTWLLRIEIRQGRELLI